MPLSGDNPHSCVYHAGPDMEHPAGIHPTMMFTLMISYDSFYLRSLTTTRTQTSQVRTIHAERESLDLQVEANFITTIFVHPTRHQSFANTVQPH